MFDLDKLRALAELAAEKNLAEITLTEGENTITLKLPTAFPAPVSIAQAAAPAMAAALPAATPSPASGGELAPAPVPTHDPNVETITAPMVGTFYAAPSPEKPAYIKVGDPIAPGTKLCIIEAMKQMNELEADITGTIIEIIAANGQPVEFGQPLFKVRK